MRSSQLVRPLADKIDILGRSNIVPIFILERCLGAVLARDKILVRFQARAKCSVARHWAVGIKPSRLLAHGMPCERKIKDYANEQNGDAEPDTHANSGRVVTGDSSAVHLAASLH